jgi:hypothetical protein
MKNLIITSVFFLISLVSFSQVITIEFQKTNTYISEGKVEYKQILEDSTNIPYSYSSNYKKEFDLDNKVCKFFINDVLRSELKIFEINKKSDTFYEIVFLEEDIRNGKDIFTYEYINNDMSYYYWYWDGDTNLSNLVSQKITNYSIK